MEHHIDLIKSMPIYEHAFTTKKSTWEKHISKKIASSGALIEIFGGKNEIEISRSDLFCLSKDGSLKKFIISVILWGYPAGMRGNHFENISQHLEKIEACLNEARHGIKNWDSHYTKTKEIEGLGLSTYTKFLYFCGASVNGVPCVILDKRIIDAARKGAISGLETLNGIATHNAAQKYPEYLKIIDTAARKYNAPHGSVEMFIFSFGLNLK